jgi:aspartate/methionine/tyrosine aminotransferase
MKLFINPAIDNMTPFIVMEVLEKANQMEQEGKNIIHLEVGEPDFEIPSPVSQASHKALDLGLTHYTHSLGAPELRNAIADFYGQEYGVTVDPECIVVTSGSSPAILLTIMCLCAAGDEIILSNPGYSCYRNFAYSCNVIPINVPVKAKNKFQYDVNELKHYITDKTRAIFVNSPMNPAGSLTDEKTYREIASLGLPIISDEIYHGLVYKGKAHTALEFTDNTFILNGFSKRFAMTGLRLGYLIAPKPYIRPLQILQQNLFICAPSSAQYAGIEALKSSSLEVNKMRNIYNERRIYMLNRLKNMGFIIETEPEGAFYIFANARKFTSDSYKFAFDVLDNAHVGITPGVDFGSNGEGYVRLSYANSLENITEGLNRLEKYLSTLTK